MLGTTHLYSVLNVDAARAVRLHQVELGRALAERAGELERSPAAEVIRLAVREMAGRMDADPYDSRAPLALQRYARLRGGSSWFHVDRSVLTRDWLVLSAAWLERDARGELQRAIAQLAQSASQARADLIGQSLPPVATFFGIVRRMDPVAVEVEGADGTRLLPRSDLERQGLAIIGQAVSLLCEMLPEGGSLVIPMPAVALDSEVAAPGDPGFPALYEFAHGAIPTDVLSEADQAWFDRSLAREPTAVPLAPVQAA